MMVHTRFSCGLLATSLVIATLTLGCMTGPGDSGSFERTLSITGSLQLELQNGSGRVEIRPGQAEQVKIHADFTVWGWPWEDSRNRAQALSTHPPIVQQGNVVRIGYESGTLNQTKIEYVIYVPADTEVRATQGSGNFDINGIQGPASLHTGSGRIYARQIHLDVEAQTGSGSVELNDVGGRVTASAGSGSITLMKIGGEVRATTGSGHIRIDHSAGRINMHTGSGGIEASGAASDVRATTGSGSIHIQGNPAASSYWEIHASSGSITLDVPHDASFRLHARSSSGGIETDLPVVLEQQISRREMRGRVGAGSASVDLQTSSGGIHIR